MKITPLDEWDEGDRRVTAGEWLIVFFLLSVGFMIGIVYVVYGG